MRAAIRHALMNHKLFLLQVRLNLRCCSSLTLACMQGCATTSIQWGAWAGAGMAAADAALLQRLVRQGYGAVTPVQGLGVLAGVLRKSSAVVAASPFDWSTFLAGEPLLHQVAGYALCPEVAAA